MKKIIGIAIPLVAVVCLLLFHNTPSLQRLQDVFSLVSSVFSEEQVGALDKDEVLIDRVVDGDTVKVQLPNGDVESVRLLLIDTPESVHPNKSVQPFGERASEFAKETLQEGQMVILEKGNPERDKYGRLLGYIFIDGKNFNKLMLEKGFARVAYVYEPNTKYLEEFKAAERKAKENEKHIWSIPGYAESDFEKY